MREMGVKKHKHNPFQGIAGPITKTAVTAAILVGLARGPEPLEAQPFTAPALPVSATGAGLSFDGTLPTDKNMVMRPGANPTMEQFATGVTSLYNSEYSSTLGKVGINTFLTEFAGLCVNELRLSRGLSPVAVLQTDQTQKLISFLAANDSAMAKKLRNMQTCEDVPLSQDSMIHIAETIFQMSQSPKAEANIFAPLLTQISVGITESMQVRRSTQIAEDSVYVAMQFYGDSIVLDGPISGPDAPITGQISGSAAAKNETFGKVVIFHNSLERDQNLATFVCRQDPYQLPRISPLMPFYATAGPSFLQMGFEQVINPALNPLSNQSESADNMEIDGNKFSFELSLAKKYGGGPYTFLFYTTSADKPSNQSQFLVQSVTVIVDGQELASSN